MKYRRAVHSRVRVSKGERESTYLPTFLIPILTLKQALGHQWVPHLRIYKTTWSVIDQIFLASVYECRWSVISFASYRLLIIPSTTGYSLCAHYCCVSYGPDEAEISTQISAVAGFEHKRNTIKKHNRAYVAHLSQRPHWCKYALTTVWNNKSANFKELSNTFLREIIFTVPLNFQLVAVTNLRWMNGLWFEWRHINAWLRSKNNNSRPNNRPETTTSIRISGRIALMARAISSLWAVLCRIPASGAFEDIVELSTLHSKVAFLRKTDDTRRSQTPTIRVVSPRRRVKAILRVATILSLRSLPRFLYGMHSSSFLLT